MSTSSSDSAETTPADQTGAHSSAALIHDRIVDLANQSSDRAEFLQRLAADLRVSFRGSTVAIQTSHWSSPEILVVDDLLSQQVDHDALCKLLASATAMPVACDIPISDSVEVNRTARGIRIELTSVPERAALLLVYPNRQRPTAGLQIEDLKRLSAYAESTRSVAAQLPIEGDAQLFPSELELPQPRSSEVLRDHNALSLFHLDLDLDATSYRIANESRRLLGCDRTSILVSIAGRYRVKAVSGVAVVDSRSNSIRALERLTQSAIVMSRPLVLPSEDPLPPQIQEPLDEYLDESGVMTAAVLPLHAPMSGDNLEGAEATEHDPFRGQGEIIGVMVLEYFSGPAPLTTNPAMALVANEATLSLRNALEHKQVFGLRLWKSIGGVVQSSRMPLVMVTLLLAAALLVASMVIQVEHHVIATGSVEPTARREVFATIDGIVKKLHVADGQSVKAGDLLLELENAELENRAESMAGEIQTLSQRLTSIQAVRLSNDLEHAQSSRLAMEQHQLESELANLQAQQQILQAQQKELLITSPIDGTVIGWQLQRRLTDRPVARGNLLVSVADHEGPWSLRLKVPDRNAGPILTAVERDPRLSVCFAVATQPQASFMATLESVSTAARLDEQGEHVIDVTASVTSDRGQGLQRFNPTDLRVGADVTAKVACGKRTILRSWFSDVFDFAYRNLLFYF